MKLNVIHNGAHVYRIDAKYHKYL